jgi:hypothetical protein
MISKKARHQMQTIKFRIADGKESQGYLLTWEGLPFGIARNRIGSLSYWNVIELQTGLSVTGTQLPTRKEATKATLDILNRKGIKAVKKRLREVFTERGSRKVKGKIRTIHCSSLDNWLTTLCGRIKGEYCVPVRHFRYVKNPCKKCQQLVKKSKVKL